MDLRLIDDLLRRVVQMSNQPQIKPANKTIFLPQQWEITFSYLKLTFFCENEWQKEMNNCQKNERQEFQNSHCWVKVTQTGTCSAKHGRLDAWWFLQLFDLFETTLGGPFTEKKSGAVHFVTTLKQKLSVYCSLAFLFPFGKFSVKYSDSWKKKGNNCFQTWPCWVKHVTRHVQG